MTRGRVAIVIAAAFALVACSDSVEQVAGPDGRTAYTMKCSDYTWNREDCRAKADELCPQGYQILDGGGRGDSEALDNNNVVVTRDQSMTFSCK